MWHFLPLFFFCVFTLDISISILILDNNLVSKHLTKVFEQKSFSSSELSQLSEPGVSEVSLVCGRGTLSSMDWVPAGPGDLMDLWGNHCHWLATADCTHCTAVHCPVHCVHTHRSRSCRGHIIDTLNIKSLITLKSNVEFKHLTRNLQKINPPSPMDQGLCFLPPQCNH